VSFLAPFFCNECKKITTKIDDLLFVDDSNSRYFCSEKCVEKHFMPVVKYFEKQDEKIRLEFRHVANDAKAVQNQNNIRLCLERPEEIWCTKNALSEEYYTFIAKLDSTESKAPLYLYLLCLLYQKKPSFIFFIGATNDERLLNYYRQGESIKDIQSYLSAVPDSPESMGASDEMLEGKKSRLLAELLEKRIPSDIPFESFLLYDKNIASTLEDPDEVYAYKDIDNDQIYVYFKAHCEGKKTYFQIVLALMMDHETSEVHDVVVPILSFPTLDPELYKNYQRGEQLSGNLKN
jgi:hypothetical protein